MIITARLLAASRSIARMDSFHGVDPSRAGLVEDIRSRASEILEVREGTLLKPYQIEYLECLRSRLEDFCLDGFEATTEWLDAFADAGEH